MYYKTVDFHPQRTNNDFFPRRFGMDIITSTTVPNETFDGQKELEKGINSSNSSSMHNRELHRVDSYISSR